MASKKKKSKKKKALSLHERWAVEDKLRFEKKEGKNK